MMLKYAGKRFGGYVAIKNLKMQYYFYWVLEGSDNPDEKVVAKVWTGGFKV